MASRMAIKRLTLEYKSLSENNAPYIEARPSEDNILQWYYVITGPPDTPFEGGQYLGSLNFPSDYPYRPPAIRMLTPSGRFEPGARLCLTMSDFHPETWNPAWNVSTILTGLLSFMCSHEVASGALSTPPQKVKEYTKRSVKWNLNNDIFTTHFPEIVSQIKQSVPDVNQIEYIEVVPPKASEIIAHIKSSYRPSAYITAQHTAKTSMRKEAEAEQMDAKADAGGPESNQYLLVLSGAIVVIAAALFFFAK